MKQLGYMDLGKGGLKSFETSQCAGGINAIYRDWSELSATEQANFNAATGDGGQSLYDLLHKYSFVNQRNSNDLPAPPCRQQGTFKPLGKPNAAPTRYQHVYKQP
jgi:hypothetical protein